MPAVYWVLAIRGADGTNVKVLPLTFAVPINGTPSAVDSKRKFAALSVELVMASEKVAETEEFVAMPVAAFAGEVADTVGGVVSNDAPLLKSQVKLVANALPAASFAAVVIVALYCVLGARSDDGVNVAVFPLADTAPAIGAPPG